MGFKKCCANCGKSLKDKKGRQVNELYDEELFKKSGILKLVDCKSCGQSIADKYVEYDGALLMIDLLLQTPAAYRHVLLNGNFSKLIVKMTLLTLICDGYIKWQEISERGEFFELEYQFYVTCFKIIMALGGYLAEVVMSSYGLALFGSVNKFEVKSLTLGLLMAYCSRFFNILAVFWSTNVASFTNDSWDRFMWYFVDLLFFVSSVKVHQVTQEAPKWISFVQLVVGQVVFVCLLHLNSILHLGSPCWYGV